MYYRKADEDRLRTNKLSHLILYKCGRTKNLPESRVLIQEKQNGEVYKIRESFASKYSIYLEFMIHLYFDANRVVRPDLKDGKTEWFLVTFAELRDVIIKIKLFMVRMF